ncbi:MAG: type IV pilus twitching motility protein PilT [Planctomycetota bacterium]
MDLDALLIDLGTRHGSDLHLKSGRPPLFRISGDLLPQHSYPELTDEDLQETFVRLMGPERFAEFERRFEADFSYEIPSFARFRVNAFIQRGHIGAVLRLIPLDVPTLEQMNLPDVLKDVTQHPNGLIIVSGPTGSGKSTTLAAMINEINRRDTVHIVTIEDPIEFVYTDDKATINQRELGMDTHELKYALRAALRQDPDVILMGEMRDAETVRFGITSAETGHLVLSTLHTNDAKQSIDRILDTFDGTEANQIRLQLALVLRAVICQRLVKRADGQGRVAALEVLINTTHVRQIIEEGGTRDLEKAMLNGAHWKMSTFNQSLFAHYSAGYITAEVALESSSNPADLELMMKGIRGGSNADELAQKQKDQAELKAQQRRARFEPEGDGKEKPKFGRGF